MLRTPEHGFGRSALHHPSAAEHERTRTERRNGDVVRYDKLRRAGERLSSRSMKAEVEALSSPFVGSSAIISFAREQAEIAIVTR